MDDLHDEIIDALQAVMAACLARLYRRSGAVPAGRVEVAVKISEILWKAANEHLNASGISRREQCWGFCCQAVVAAMGEPWWVGTASRNDYPEMPAIVFLQELGMPLQRAFDHVDLMDEQQVRYAWLMFASMYAAELEARGEL
jgi:hypothetical protein